MTNCFITFLSLADTSNKTGIIPIHKISTTNASKNKDKCPPS